MAQLPAIKWGMIARIVGPEGGVSTVFTDDPMSIAANVVYAKQQKAYVVPGWYPMSYPATDVAMVVTILADHAVDAVNPCGTCRACCIVPELSDGDEYKPPNTPCRHLCGEGCGVYKTRPSVCKRFECLWLTSQRSNDPMIPELRPDRCGAFLTNNSLASESDERIEIHRFRDHGETNTHLHNFLTEQRAMGRTPDVVTHYVKDGLK